MKKRKIYQICLSFFVVLGFVACTKNDFGTFAGVQLGQDVALPVGKATFVFGDFIKSDSVVQIGRDSSISIVYAQDSVAAYAVADILNSATGNLTSNANRTVAIGNLPIPSVVQSQSTTLSQFGAGIDVGTPPSPQLVLLKNLFQTGGTGAVPAFNITTNTTTDIPAFTDYQTLTLASGKLVMAITNNFPYPLTNLQIQILDRGNSNVLLGTFTFPTVAAGATSRDSIDLGGRSMSNQFSYRIPSFASPGTGTNIVTVSPTQALAVTVNSSNFSARSGSVKVTEQSMSSDRYISTVNPGNASAKIKEVTVRSAVINYNISKTVGASFRMLLSFPSIRQNGVPFSQTINLTSNSTTGTINLNNAVVGLDSILAQPYNQLPIDVRVTVLSSGANFINFASTDVIAINSSFSNFVIEAAKGQFGTFNVAIPASSQKFAYDFSFLSPDSRPIFFDNPTIKMKYTNSFGIPVSAAFNISATGLLGNAPLSAPSFNFSYPSLAQIGTNAQSVRDSFTISKTNSQIVNFLSVLPSQINYSGNVTITSPNPNNPTEINYFTNDSKIKVGLEVGLPLKFATENLILKDTVESSFDVSEDQLKNFDKAWVNLQHKNGFPMSTTIDIMTLSPSGVKETVISNVSIGAASVDGTGKVAQPNIGKQDVQITKEQLDKLLKSNRWIVVAKVKTTGDGTTKVAMYTHYTFEVGVGLRVKLQ